MKKIAFGLVIIIKVIVSENCTENLSCKKLEEKYQHNHNNKLSPRTLADYFSRVASHQDSSSAIEQISSCTVKNISEFWPIETKRLIVHATENGFDIRLALIPEHSNIPGNEEADTLANIGRNLNIPMAMPLDVQDIYTDIKSKVYDDFRNKWNNLISIKDYQYRKVQPTFPKNKWFAIRPFIDRRHITTIIRLRTGHCLTKENLHRMNLTDNPYCECGSRENLNHSHIF
ncbi:uncharacterized protein LOC126885602 [Diabrotica virgifera virgifera]|uniref:RNase H type-1 domain-containing protein n=1 Tax=Diabrotica virgifera virgifera TaxID=50390 RepID=A0ABM5KD95_DIAVI|nr:uncharacterized protein LOC126885602 [Diabrotica virgifera virgifera]